MMNMIDFGRITSTSFLAILFCVPFIGLRADEIASNVELAELFAMDQADRETEYEGIDWDVVGERDQQRRSRVLELLRSGQLRASKDFLHAAYIFQHGNTVDEARLALSLSWVAANIDPDDDEAKWLTASAWDRLMMRQGQPQWYGTQLERRPGDTEWQLYNIQEDAVTDVERRELNVPALDELKEQFREMNKQ